MKYLMKYKIFENISEFPKEYILYIRDIIQPLIDDGFKVSVTKIYHGHRTINIGTEINREKKNPITIYPLLDITINNKGRFNEYDFKDVLQHLVSYLKSIGIKHIYTTSSLYDVSNTNLMDTQIYIDDIRKIDNLEYLDGDNLLLFNLYAF